MYVHLALILGCWTVVLQGAETDVGERADNRRPIWNLAHMVNAVKQIPTFLDLGANALEADVTFKGSVPTYTYHGTPCDFGRDCIRWEYFNVFLKTLREYTTPGNAKYRDGFILFVLDLKTGSLSNDQVRPAGENVAKELLQNYWNNGNNGGRAYVVLSLPDIGHYEFVRGFKEVLKKEGHEDLLEKVGYDFSGPYLPSLPTLDATHEAYKKAGVDGHIWLSDGLTNFSPLGDMARLKEAIKSRDSANGFINKIYYWSVDKYSTTRTALDVGVDGIMTNYPNVLIDVLNEDGYKDNYRLATYDDNPWETYKK
uniref:Dermonecrotic toxin n=1 Tax=Loxosceles laeta TaxID=58217 RepID=A31_LOXLA|nr:RecName: Full=Dermonecrotic toxin; AltName: Full=Phospholipase D isoform 1; Short=LlPLD1; Short=PLD1; AltName: Full=Sphingomyelin phosphodiesterase D; Short=SMD; Short=SMase D; Short=Sphingomyelinase D; Flags: Precursor [Loxosceles laeta]ADP00408.1 phospholipase D isoform 1 [Loxosceles laeta]